jgi:hypothetical protein
LVAILGSTSAGRVFGLVFGVLWATWTFRLFRMGAYPRVDGVKIVGFFFSRSVPWGDIDHFAVLPAGRYKTVGHFVRAGHHQPIPIFAISPGSWWGKDPVGRAEAQIDGLNRELAEHCSAQHASTEAAVLG